MQGLFITLEGGEGAGKSSLIKNIASFLEAKFGQAGPEILFTREPGSSSIGTPIRELILGMGDSAVTLDPKAEALLFAAERAQHVAEKIAPTLAKEGIVICDRFIDSSYAYQAKARGLGDFIKDLSSWTIANRNPDLTIIIDIDPELGLQRKHNQKELNKMEKESLDFHKKVREAFLDLDKSSDPRFFLVDGSKSADEVSEIVLNKIELLLEAKGY